MSRTVPTSSIPKTNCNLHYLPLPVPLKEWKRCSCTICDEEFLSPNDLKTGDNKALEEHMRSRHLDVHFFLSDNDKLISCALCGLTITTYKKLNYHLVAHNGSNVSKSLTSSWSKKRKQHEIGIGLNNEKVKNISTYRDIKEEKLDPLDEDRKGTVRPLFSYVKRNTSDGKKRKKKSDNSVSQSSMAISAPTEHTRSVVDEYTKEKESAPSYSMMKLPISFFTKDGLGTALDQGRSSKGKQKRPRNRKVNIISSVMKNSSSDKVEEEPMNIKDDKVVTEFAHDCQLDPVSVTKDSCLCDGTCPNCVAAFSDASTFHNYVDMHACGSRSPYSSSQCNGCTSPIVFLGINLVQHYIYNHFNELFTAFRGYNSNIKSSHIILKCRLCSRSFGDFEQLNFHFKAHSVISRDGKKITVQDLRNKVGLKGQRKSNKSLKTETTSGRSSTSKKAQIEADWLVMTSSFPSTSFVKRELKRDVKQEPMDDDETIDSNFILKQDFDVKHEEHSEFSQDTREMNVDLDLDNIIKQEVM